MERDSYKIGYIAIGLTKTTRGENFGIDRDFGNIVSTNLLIIFVLHP